MTQALRDDQPEASSQLPADLPESTVSEIASWLVGQPLDAVERELIRHTLESCGGDRALTASVLGISLPALRKKIRAYAVRGEALPDSFEPAKEIPQAANDETPAQASAEEITPVAQAEAAPEPQPVEAAAEEIVEPTPTLAVPDADNDPSLTLVQTEGVAGPAAVQPEPEIVVTPEIVPAVAEVATEPVVEAPKLIAGIAAPRAKQKTNYAGPVVAGTLTLLLAAPIAYGLLTTQEKSTAIDVDRNRLEVTAIESPRFEQRIQVPVWAAPARTESAMPADIAADRRAPAPVPAEPVAQVEPVTVAEPAIVAAPVLTVADFSAEPGTEMELGPVNIAADVALDLGPVNRLADVRMELAPADIAADTRMDAGPVDILADVRMEFLADPEITGSVPAATFFKAPKNAPAPLARVEPSDEDDKPVRRQAARPARAAEPAEAAQLPFPFFPFAGLFSLKTDRTATDPVNAGSGLQPVDCCIR